VPRTVLLGLGLLGVGWLLQRAPAGTAGREYRPWLVVSGAVLLAALLAGGRRHLLIGEFVRHRVSGYPAVIGLGLLSLGWLLHQAPSETPGQVYWPWCLATGAVLIAAVFVGWRHRRGGSAGLVGRWSRRSRRHEGVAGF
jgi:type IV secretion system protein VirD4